MTLRVCPLFMPNLFTKLTKRLDWMHCSWEVKLRASARRTTVETLPRTVALLSFPAARRCFWSLPRIPRRTGCLHGRRRTCATKWTEAMNPRKLHKYQTARWKPESDLLSCKPFVILWEFKANTQSLTSDPLSASAKDPQDSVHGDSCQHFHFWREGKATKRNSAIGCNRSLQGICEKEHARTEN